jgi:AcrR family transcriptional regulator
VDFVLEAAAQVLETAGEAGFNTNAVAERAGVSIGTIYRYFPDKTAILRALALRETEAHRRAVMDVLGDGSPGMAPDRAMIRAFIRAFAGRSQARRIAVSALLAHADHRELAAKFAAVESGIKDAEGRPVTRVQAFVLGRAIQGAMRAAVLEGADFLLSQEFEDELVRLGRAYLGYRSSSSG